MSFTYLIHYQIYLTILIFFGSKRGILGQNGTLMKNKDAI